MTKLAGVFLCAVLVLTSVIALAQSGSGGGRGAGEGALDQLAFLAGSWRSADDESIVEEMWSQPRGNNIMGCFRWLSADGEARMFELLTITHEKDGATRLRLRHHSASLAAKEDKDKPMTLKLASSGRSRAEFAAEKDAGDLERVVYEVKGDHLEIDIMFKGEGDAARQPLRFRLKKVAM